MLLLILGLAAFVLPHLIRRLAPGLSESLGPARKGIVALVSVIGVVLMVIGYRAADFVPVYEPLAGMGHLNNLLMLVAVYLYGVGGTKGTLHARIRHPMLLGTLLWAVGHLLVNGDRASVVLFGGLAIWAVGAIVLLNRAGPWARPTGGRGVKGDLMNLAGTVVLFGLFAGVHIWLGRNPFLGTYG